jgi:hypothetical protein
VHPALISIVVGIGFALLVGWLIAAGVRYDRREMARQREVERLAAEKAERERLKREDREARLARERAEAERIARTWEVMTEAERAALPIERRVEMLETWERVRGGRHEQPPPAPAAEERASSSAPATQPSRPGAPRERAHRASAWWPSSTGGKALMVVWLGLAALSGFVHPELRRQDGPPPGRLTAPERRAIQARSATAEERILMAVVSMGSVYLVTVFVRWLVLSAARAAAARGQS